MPDMDKLPQPIKNAMLHALIRAGAEVPSADNPVDDSPQFVMEAISGGEGHESLEAMLHGLRKAGRRNATDQEAAPLLLEKCPFKPGDKVRWRKNMRPGDCFPDEGMAVIVTQVFTPPLHDLSDLNSNRVAVRNDIAIAYMAQEGDDWHVEEFLYDSRRFELAVDRVDGVARRKEK